MTLPLLREQPSEELQTRLIRLLSDGAWHHRMWIAYELGTTVRIVRAAANHAQGHVLSSSRGLKLTECATDEEMAEAVGRFQSQIRAMTRRLDETEEVWNERDGGPPDKQLTFPRRGLSL